MTTKGEERRALENIRQIVAGLGKDSYVAWAFEGCFEIAEDNISNDFANSPRKSIDHLRNVNIELKEKVKEQNDLFEGAKKELDKALQALDDRKSRVTELTENNQKLWNQYCAETSKSGMLECKVEDLELEIIKLKARLFDMMEAEKQ